MVLPDGSGCPAAVPTTPPPARLKLAVSSAVSTAVITLHGTIDGPGGKQLAVVLREAIGSGRHQLVVVDLRDVPAAEPSAVEVFRAASRHAHSRGVTLRLYGPPSAISDLLTAAWLSQELEIVP